MYNCKNWYKCRVLYSPLDLWKFSQDKMSLYCIVKPCSVKDCHWIQVVNLSFLPLAIISFSTYTISTYMVNTQKNVHIWCSKKLCLRYTLSFKIDIRVGLSFWDSSCVITLSISLLFTYLQYVTFMKTCCPEVRSKFSGQPGIFFPVQIIAIAFIHWRLSFLHFLFCFHLLSIWYVFQEACCNFIDAVVSMIWY